MSEPTSPSHDEHEDGEEPGRGVAAPKPATRSRLIRVLTVSIVPALIVVLIAWVRTRFLFSTPVHEGGDLAVDSLLVNRATHLHQLFGNYSRTGFYHPGPGLFYILGAGQVLFFTVLHAVPAPMNGQMLGGSLYAAVVIGLCTLSIFRMASSRLAAWLAFGGLALFATHNLLLTSVWPPDLNVTTFVLFAFTGAAVATGSSADVPAFVLGAGLLVHGHVSFILFVVVTVPLVAASWAHAHRLGRRQEVRQHRRAFVGAIALVALLALPIVAETLLHWPGQWGNYWHYVRTTNNASRTVGDVVHFVRACWSNAGIPAPLAGMGAVIGLVLILTEHDARRCRTFGCCYAMVALQTVLFTFYVWRGVDVLVDSNLYVGRFFAAVPVLLCVTVAAHLCVRVLSTVRPDARVAARSVRWVFAASTVVLVWAASTAARLDLVDRGSPAYADAATTLSRSDVRGDRTVAINFPVTIPAFLAGAGVAIALERRGVPWCVRAEYWGLNFTRARLCPADATGLWPVDLDTGGAAPSDPARVVYTSPNFAIVEATRS